MDTRSSPMYFISTNTGQSKGTPTHRDYFPENQPNRPKYLSQTDETEELIYPKSPIPHGQRAPKQLKPGLISRSELSSGTNAFKLRAKNTTGTQKKASSTRLRQEVFKKPHTSAPSLQNLGTATTTRFAPVSGPSTSGDIVAKALNKQTKDRRAPETLHAPSPPLMLETEPALDMVRASGRINTGQPRRSSVHNQSSLLSFRTTQPVIEEPNTINAQDHLPRAAIFSPVIADLPPAEPRYQTPTRESVVPTTPSSAKTIREDNNSAQYLRHKCGLYEVELKANRDFIASQDQTIGELSSKNAQMEEKTRNLESKHAAKVKEITQRADDSLAKLNDLHEKVTQAGASQIKELKHGLDDLRQEIRDSMNGVEPILVRYDEIRNTLRELAEEHEQQMLEHGGEKTRLQQTNDLLRDQLSDRTGNYTESLEREKELQTSLIALGESHANIAKALSTLNEQHEQVNTKYSDSRLAESVARKRVEELEEVLTGLKVENARIKSLLFDNEKAFSHKLQVLEEDNDNMRTGLEGAHKELNAFKSGEQAMRSQVEALLREKEDLSQSSTALERDLELKIQSLEDTRTRNQALERQLNDERQGLETARTQSDQTMGRLVERDQAASVQIQGLNAALESYREREGSLINEIATLNALVSNLREKVKEADEAAVEHRALEKALSQKCADIDRVEIENGQLQSQVVQLELARDALNEEVKQLRDNNSVTRERESIAQKEICELRQRLKESHDESEKARINIARMQGETQQIKVALEKEKDAHRATEKQRETSLLSFNKLQAEQKALLDNALAAEKKSRLSVEGSHERIKKLELRYTERETELKRLSLELNASNAAKATLETLVAEFRTSIQRAGSQHEKIEAQESEITTLNNQVSNQETELRLLEQRLANADAHLVDARADANSHKEAAAAFESQLKQKEQDIVELRSRQLPQIDTTLDAGPASLLQNKIAEQEDAIKDLKSQVLELEKKSETIVERYKSGKLTNPEKDFLGVITTSVVQEKNRTINNLKGELKRAGLKAQLEPNGPKDPARWQPFNNEVMTVTSSPLSDPLHAPDHDPPTPDSPAVQITERPVQNSRSNEQARLGQSMKSKPPPTAAPIRLESGNAADEIQDFEEFEELQDAASTNRKRTTLHTEPLDEEDEEEPEPEPEPKRKTRVKAKKDNKVTGESNGPKGQSNKADVKGKATKRRKV
ncbi:unnamed protein product [Rhizoctonia solani]|uniref:Uncharacterized protein n=1 Tax=Rhizoctonia solani TaxID=456999 RepID=A0A8H3D3Z6_9AGAM|nr:unnamed protein product [Rhizoctonia solani]